MNNGKKFVIVLGAGAWGTAIAIALHRAGQEVRLLPKFPFELDHLKNNRENTDWLPNIVVPQDIQFGPCYDDLNACQSVFHKADAIFWAIPVQFSVEIMQRLAVVINPKCPIVICSKGLILDEEAQTGVLLSTALTENLYNPVAVLSGPNFAREVAMDYYTSAVMASSDVHLAMGMASLISSKKFRVYMNQDVISVQIAGALKNVIAIACGIALGLEFGQNSISALISMGISECSKISTKQGGSAETLLGVSGVGDITLTCLSVQSRNTGFGLKIGKGESKEAIQSLNKQAVEGYFTAKSAHYMIRKLDVDTPVLNAVYDILYKGADPRLTLEKMLASPDHLELETFH